MTKEDVFALVDRLVWNSRIHHPVAASDEDELKLAISKLLTQRDELQERLDVLNVPGKMEAIIQGMWSEAERRGHPPASSKHALTFLLQKLDKEEAHRDSLLAEVEKYKRTNIIKWWWWFLDDGDIRCLHCKARIEIPEDCDMDVKPKDFPHIECIVLTATVNTMKL